MRPITSRVTDPPQRVCDLLNANVEWDIAVLAEVFLPVDVVAIRSIPICTRQVDDFWSWAHEKNGVFSVRSTYRMVVSTKIRREAWFEGRANM